MRHQEQVHNTADQEWIEELLPNKERCQKEKAFELRGRDIWELVKELVATANVVKISIWHRDHLLASIPIVYGGAMAAIFPYLSLFSLISLLALQCRVIVERTEK